MENPYFSYLNVTRYENEWNLAKNEKGGMYFWQDIKSQYLIAHGDIVGVDENGVRVKENRGFINFACFHHEKLVSDEIENYCDNQLKLHICLPENNLNHRIKGWNIVTDILIASKIPEFKIINPSINLNEWDSSQRGKDVTVYPFLRSSRNMDYCHGLNDLNELRELVARITQVLVKHRVQPGYRPVLHGDLECTGREDYPIPGTNYITLRASSYVNLTNNEMEEISQFLSVSPKVEGTFFSNTPYYYVIPDVRVVTV
jgi:hypothetical protein